MKTLTVLELSELYGMNRQNVYKRIKKGDLSKNAEGKIDLSEAIRVFGEPAQYQKKSVASLQSDYVKENTEVDLLKQQVDMLKKQLELAQDREIFQREQLLVKDEQIQTIQLSLSEPKQKTEREEVNTKSSMFTNAPQNAGSVDDEKMISAKPKSLFSRIFK